MTLPTRLLMIASAMLATPLGAHAAPALWQVSDGDSKIWLFGSVHLLPPDVEWRTEVFDKVLAGADKVYFETDVGPNAATSILARTFEIGMNPLGTTLSSQLPPADADALRAMTAKMELPVGMLQAMKPWLAANTIVSAAAVTAGYDPQSGVDIVLQNELPEGRKAYFETGDQQLDFLAGAPQAEQVAMLIDTVGQADQLSGKLDDMVTAWAAGTPEILADAFFDELAGYEAFAQRLIYDRNNTWLTRIDAMLANNEEDLIVVGAGHLIGDGSVIDLLDKQGFRIKRLQ